MLVSSLLISSLALPRVALAEPLPSVAAATAALWQAPAVLAAQAELAAQQMDGAALAAGDAEWSVGGDLAQRRVGGAASDTYTETGVHVSRPLRTPARAAADRALGDAGVAVARANLGETLHEAGRELLVRWFDWVGETQFDAVWQAQRELVLRQRDIVARRVKLGEAPASEIVAVDAALAQATHQATLASSRRAQALAALQRDYPALATDGEIDFSEPVALPTALPVGLPVALNEHAGSVADSAAPASVGANSAEADWIKASLDHNHELARARAAAEQQRRHTERLASRVGVDPSVGVFARRENGDESVLGVNLSFTLPGAARQLERDAARLRADAAVQAVSRLEARLRREAQATYQNDLASYRAWQAAAAAARSLDESARLAARAFELGEGELSQVLASRRLTLEGRLAEVTQRRDAHAARARLLLDTHKLWPLDRDGEAHEGDGHAHH